MRLLWLEMVKLRHQKRTWIGLAALAILPIIMTVAFYLSSGEQSEGANAGITALLMHAARNGVVMPLATLVGLSTFLLPLAASMVGAFLIAGEAETGTIKTILVRPVRRGSLLMAKWTVAALYLLLALVVIDAVSVASGSIAFGTRPLLMPGGVFGVGETVGKTALAYLMTLAAMTCVVSLALLFSTMTNSSLTAAVVSLVAVIAVQILTSFAFFDFLRPWVFTTYFTSWTDLFVRPMPVDHILQALGCFVSYSTVFTLLAWWRFRRRDILV